MQHALGEGGVTEPLADDQVDLLIQPQFTGPTMQDLNPVRQAVGPDQVARDLRDIGRINGVDLPRSGFGGQHRQDAGTGSHVQHDVARLDDFADRGSEGVRAGAIAHHPPLQFDVTVGLQVVVDDRTPS